MNHNLFTFTVQTFSLKASSQKPFPYPACIHFLWLHEREKLVGGSTATAAENNYYTDMLLCYVVQALAFIPKPFGFNTNTSQNNWGRTDLQYNSMLRFWDLNEGFESLEENSCRNGGVKRRRFFQNEKQGQTETFVEFRQVQSCSSRKMGQIAWHIHIRKALSSTSSFSL